MYSINSSSIIKPNSKYSVSITLHEADVPGNFHFKIRGPEFEQIKEVEVQPKSTELIDFNIPEISEGDYEIQVKGSKGVFFKKTKSITFQKDKDLLVFIQTDKATYKPGDLVRFRVLFLDSNTCPAKIIKPINFLLYDNDKNLLKQLKNIEIKNGIYSSSYQLTEFANLGNWEICIQKDNETIERKNIEIAKYVLPKFDVKIETPPDISIEDKTLKVKVSSNYTYGRPVSGKLIVSVQSENRYYCEENEKISLEKSIDFEGSANLDIDIEYPKSFNSSLIIKGTVEEGLTGITQEGSATVHVHLDKYSINGLDVPDTFNSGIESIIKVAIKKYDGTPVFDTKNPVSLIAERSSYSESSDSVDEEILKYERFLNENGIVEFAIQFPYKENTTTQYTLKARYDETENWIGHISHRSDLNSSENLGLILETESPSIHNDLMVSLTFDKPLGPFVYFIEKKGEILKTERVNPPENTKKYCISIKPTFEMIPNSKMFAFLYDEGDLIMEELSINLEKELMNDIQIETAEQARAGQELDLKIKASENSFVGLLGIDQSVLLLKDENNFEASLIIDKIQGRRYGWEHLITITNADFQDELLPIQMRKKIKKKLYKSIQNEALYDCCMYGEERENFRVRKDFPETWIWDDIETCDSITTAKKTVPDIITSWIISGFVLHETYGLGITKEATKLKVFQPFFVSMNLPYSIKRGETISVPVTVFNYLDKETTAEISLDVIENDFHLVDEEKSNKSLNILPNSGKNVYFKISAKKVGLISLKVKAVSPLAGDIIHQMLKVEPEGVTEFRNKAILLDLSEKSEDSLKIHVEIPENIVPDSENIELSLVGDILGPTIQNIDKLVRKPYGCGEQNMVNFVPNILVLQYLRATNQSNENIERKAKKFLEIGYERELSYKHRDGSYSAFGSSGGSCGSTWLTAYVARSFYQAQQFTFIDPNVIEKALEFLVSTQQENGSFKEDGKLFDHHHGNGEDKGLALSAFVLLAFLENKESLIKYGDTITKGVTFLLETIDTINDLYAESIATYAISLANQDISLKILENLEKKSTKSNDKKFWVLPKKEDKKTYWRPKNHDVEVTSYAFLAFAGRQSITEMIPTIKWLIAQRNSEGGFDSTQDTVVGLQALTMFAQKSGCGNAEMNVEFKTDEGSNGSFSVSKENSLVLQSHILPKSTKFIEVCSKGRGSCLLQVSYKFNLDTTDEDQSFDLKPTVKVINRDLLILNIKTKFIGEKSNMAVLEINLPSGYIADKSSFEKVLDEGLAKKIETKNNDSVAVIYFESLSRNEICVEIGALKTHQIENLKKCAVLIYDYYDNTKFAKEYYNL